VGGVLILSVLIVALAGLGIQNRLAEYEPKGPTPS
jgi:hypothetical protein